MPESDSRFFEQFVALCQRFQERELLKVESRTGKEGGSLEDIKQKDLRQEDLRQEEFFREGVNRWNFILWWDTPYFL